MYSFQLKSEWEKPAHLGYIRGLWRSNPKTK